MRIGIKLDLGFSTTETYQRLYGEDQILAYLREIGIQAVETPIGPTTADSAIREHARLCLQEGLHLSLHPYSETTLSNPGLFSTGDNNPCRRFHERVFAAAAEVAQLQEAEAIVNIHPAAGLREGNRSKLIEQSVRFFEWAHSWCCSTASGVRPVAELQIRPNPNEPIQRVGDHYAELLEVVGRSGCEACWDFGHAYMNTRRFGLSLDPPGELLTRVAHVHCHDANSEDHQPLIFGNVPWQRYLRELAVSGFDGAVILEVPPQSFLAAGGLDAVVYSVGALTQCVDEL